MSVAQTAWRLLYIKVCDSFYSSMTNKNGERFQELYLSKLKSEKGIVSMRSLMESAGRCCTESVCWPDHLQLILKPSLYWPLRETIR